MGWHRIPGWTGACAFMLGCGARVIDGTSPGSTSATGGGEPAPIAVVARAADPGGPCYLNESLNPSGAVFVIVASESITCSETLPAAITDTTCGPGSPFVWEVCVALLPSSLAIGTVDLTAAGLNAEEMDVGRCNGNCCGGSSVFSGQGTLEITAVDASSVTFALAGTSESASVDGTVTANGTYTAPRCP
jgi:hypothetical protein